ncbi:MAG: protein kinase [Planctomycetes bacterium]|nr:protein kinase [Planctomycetota bacterium]
MARDRLPDFLLGQLALRKGLVTPAQLAECLREQASLAAGGTPAPLVGTLLCRRGYLALEALADLLMVQENARLLPPPRDEAWPADSRFGRRLVAHELASPDQVEQAIRIQTSLHEHGISLRLGEILVSRGVLTELQVRDALALQDKTILVCPPCGKAFNVEGYAPGVTTPCPGCGARLAPPADGGTIRVDGSILNRPAGALPDASSVPVTSPGPAPREEPIPAPPSAAPAPEPVPDSDSAAASPALTNPAPTPSVQTLRFPVSAPEAPAPRPAEPARWQPQLDAPPASSPHLSPPAASAVTSDSPTLAEAPTPTGSRDKTLLNAAAPPPGPTPAGSVTPATLIVAGAARAATPGSDSPTPPALAPSPRPVPTKTPAPEPVGVSFGRYRLLKELGRGGMGVVHKAWDCELKRVVALKLLLGESGASADDVERFQREARAAGRLRHPNIVQVHDVGTCDSRHFFTMDFIEGESLDSAKGRLAPRKFLETLRDVARALHAAHEAGVIHRDVKPANILLDPAGRPYVSDFGLAKEVREGAAGRGTTLTGTVMGTPYYMSPEQAQGRISAIGAPSDLWSLGVMLYEHLTGRMPFEGENPLRILMAIQLSDPPLPCKTQPPGSAGRRVHRDLETVCMKCLEKDPSRRYPTAGALADDLTRFLDGEAIEARPISRSERALRKLRKNRVTVAAAAVCLLFAVVLGGVFLVQKRATDARRRELTRGQELFRQGLEGDAERIYNDLLRADPDFADGLLARARLRLRQGRRAEARTDLDAAIRSDPRPHDALLERGRLSDEAGEFVDAAQDFARALEVSGGSELARVERAWAWLGDACREDGPGTAGVAGPEATSNRAAAEFGDCAAKAASPEVRASARAGQAVLRLRAGEADAARALLDQALQEDPNCYRARLERGRLRLAAGKGSEAEPDLAVAAGLEPSRIAAVLEHARAWHAALRDDDALADCRAAAGRFPEDPRPDVLTARFSAGVADALAAADRAVAKAPHGAEPRVARGWLSLAGRQEGWAGNAGVAKTTQEARAAAAAGAAADFREALAAAPRSAAALAGLALATLRGGDVQGALGWAQRAVQADPALAEAHGVYGEALRAGGDETGARGEYERCEALAASTPFDGIALSRLEALLARLADPEFGVPDLAAVAAVAQEADALAPRLGRDRPHVGRPAFLAARAAFLAGDFGRAIAAVTEALERDPYLTDALLLRLRLRLEGGLWGEPQVRKDVDEAIRLLPEDPRPWAFLGRARHHAREYDAALEAYDRGLKLAPDLAVLHRQRAESFRKLKRDADVYAADKAGEAGRQDLVAARDFQILAHLRNSQMRFEAATQLATRGIAEAPRVSQLFDERAEALWATVNFDSAFLDLGRAMRLDPRCSVKFYVRGASAFGLAKKTAALLGAGVGAVVKGNTEEPVAFTLQPMVALFGYASLDVGIRDAGRALDMEPKFAVAYSLRGLLKTRKGDRVGGLEDLETGIRLAPHGGLPQYLLAQHYVATGEKEKAIEALRAALPLGHSPYTFGEQHEVVRREAVFGEIQKEDAFKRLFWGR